MGAITDFFVKYFPRLVEAEILIVKRRLGRGHWANYPARINHSFFEILSAMINNRILDEIAAKIRETLADSPAKDIEKNIKAMLQSGFAKLNLISREEFDVQSQVLLRTREKLTKLEAQVAALEARTTGQSPEQPKQ